MPAPRITVQSANSYEYLAQTTESIGTVTLTDISLLCNDITSLFCMWFDWRRYKAAPWDHHRTHPHAATARIGAMEPMTSANLLEKTNRIRIQRGLRLPSANPVTIGATEPVLVAPSETMANTASVFVSVGASETIANVPSKIRIQCIMSVDDSEITIPVFFKYRETTEEFGGRWAALQSSTLTHGVTEPMMPCGATELSVSTAMESNTRIARNDYFPIPSRQTAFLDEWANDDDIDYQSIVKQDPTDGTCKDAGTCRQASVCFGPIIPM